MVYPILCADKGESDFAMFSRWYLGKVSNVHTCEAMLACTIEYLRLTSRSLYPFGVINQQDHMLIHPLEMLIELAFGKIIFAHGVVVPGRPPTPIEILAKYTLYSGDDIIASTLKYSGLFSSTLYRLYWDVRLLSDSPIPDPVSFIII